MKKRVQYVNKKKFYIICLVGMTVCFICIIFYLFYVLPNKHDHHGHLDDRPGVRIHGKIVDYTLNESGGGSMYIEVDHLVWERDDSSEKAKDREIVRVPIQNQTIIKNKFGWRVDVSHIAKDICVIACVPNEIYLYEESRFVACYEIWIQ